jgi:two-component system response regulator PilR (NtrC family)
MQVKLLRVIQEKQVRAVGASTEVPVDVRVLSATHKDLARLVDEGRFRHDLYYRINVIEIGVPALRERRDDIALLARCVLARLAEELGEPAPALAADAEDALREYAFPGNVRELENILERAVAMAEGTTITRADLRLPAARGGEAAATAAGPGGVEPEAARAGALPPAAAQPPVDAAALPDYIEQLEREAIQKALEECRYNKTKAAAKLGITFRALRYKLKKLGIE